MKPQHLIILSFGLFMTFILVLVVKTYHINTELVSDNYYQQELDYQKQINKMQHTKSVTHQWQDHDLVLLFPEDSNQAITGKIEFYRPADASKDLAIPIQLNNVGEQRFRRELFAKGLYKMKVDWATTSGAYYYEHDLYVP